MKRWLVLIVLLGFLFPSVAWAADVGTVTQTLYVYGVTGTPQSYSETDSVPPWGYGKLRMIKLEFVTGPAGGTVGTLTAEDLAWSIDGWIIKVEVVAGSTAPDADYNVILLDDQGIDVLGAVLDGISGSVALYSRIPQVNVGTGSATVYGPQLVAGDLSFDVTDNGTADADGTVYVYFCQ